MSTQLIQFSSVLCQSSEAQRRWEILSNQHKRNWDELLSKVREFIEGRCGSGKEECWMPVVYGVYGSGKTTMLVELCEWSLRSSIPAVRVNLSRIVSYIKEKKRGGTINEEDLPKYTEDFFQEYLASKLPKELFENVRGRRGILIIDEVEESFGELKNLVSGKSILRGLADSVRIGDTNVLVVLGFAPSSILAEAVLQYATSWRVKLIPLPSVSIDTIYKRYVQDLPLDNKLKSYEVEVRTLVSNALWWLSKGGRPGWLDKLKREKVIEGLFSTLNYLINTNNFREVGLCYEFPQDRELSRGIKDTLETKPVEGAPLFDNEEYLEILRRVRSEFRDVPADKSVIMEALVKLLTCLVGPVSSDLLKALLGSEIPSGLRPPDVIVRREELIDMDVLINTYLEALKKNFNLEGDLIAKMRDYLKSVLEPWSVNSLMIYDRDELKILLEEVLPLLLIENMQENLLDYVSKLDIDKILRDAFRERPPLERKDYYSLRVKTLRSLYKPVVVTPLIGCSKGMNIDKMINDITKRSDLYDLIPEELKKELESSGFRIYPVLNVRNLTRIDAKDQILQGKNVVFLLFTNIPSLRESVGELEKELKKQYRGLLDKYWVFRLELPPVLAQYLIGYMYSKTHCPDELERLAGMDKVLDAQARRQLKELLGEVVKTALDNSGKLRSVLPELSSEDLKRLDDIAHGTVGSKHAEYMWLIGGFDKASELLLEYLRVIRPILTTEIEGLQYDLDKDKVMRGFKGALMEGERYMRLLRESMSKLGTSLVKEDFKDVVEFLRGLLELYVENEGINVCSENPHKIVSKIRNVMREKMYLTFDEVALTMLLSKMLQEHVKESGCGSVSVPESLIGTKNNLSYLINGVDKLNSRLNEFRDLIQDYVKKALLPDASKALNLLRNKYNELIQLHKAIDDLPTYEKLLLKHYLTEQFNDLPNSLQDIRSEIEKITSHMISIKSYLDQLREIEADLKMRGASKVYEVIRSDLSQILSQVVLPIGIRQLKKIENDLSNYHITLKQYLEKSENIIKRVEMIKKNLDDIKESLR